jgi:hypothetical protein
MLVFGDLVWIPFTFSIQACEHELKQVNMKDCFLVHDWPLLKLPSIRLKILHENGSFPFVDQILT